MACGVDRQVRDLGLFQERHPKPDLAVAGGYVHFFLACGEGYRAVEACACSCSRLDLLQDAM